MQSEEVWLHPRYAIARFMKTKTAFKTLDNSNNTLMTAKVIQEKNIPKQLHIHFRMDGKDYWNKLDDIIDIDLYIGMENLEQLAKLIEEMKNENRESVAGNPSGELCNQEQAG